MRSPLGVIVLLSLGCAAVANPVAESEPTAESASSEPAPDSCGESPESIAACIDPDRYAADLAFITDVRPPQSAHWQAVQDLCVDRLKAAGYEVETAAYATGVNVIGRIDGSEEPDEVVLVSAHYDHIPDCPGADDNATGVAAALEIARVLAAADLPRTVMVACWDEEETALRGSTAFAERAAADGMDIVINYNFDMIGFTSDEPNTQRLSDSLYLFPDAVAKIEANDNRADFILVVANAEARESADDLIDEADRVDLPTALIAVPEGEEMTEEYSDTRRSDHASLWAVGYPAVLMTDTADLRNRHYHCREGGDVLEDLDEAFSIRVARATAAATAVAAGL